MPFKDVSSLELWMPLRPFVQFRFNLDTSYWILYAVFSLRPITITNGLFAYQSAHHEQNNQHKDQSGPDPEGGGGCSSLASNLFFLPCKTIFSPLFKTSSKIKPLCAAESDFCP